MTTRTTLTLPQLAAKPKSSRRPRARFTAPPRVLVLERGFMTTDRLRQAGAKPVRCDPSDPREIERAFRRSDVHALVLTGGGDVDPRRYGARRAHPMVYGVNEQRDAAELDALDGAGDLGIPVLGICRGMQLMNVHAGGSLTQHLADTRLGATGAHRHRNSVELVNLEPRSLVAHAFTSLRAPVLHLHHQAVRRVGAGYRASASHADGTVEAIESTLGNWWVGVQFHPEYARPSEPGFALFQQLVLQAAIFADLVQWTPRAPSARASQLRIVEA